MTTLQDIRRWAVTARPVFICGLERSGTSILQVSMSRHPDLFAVKDVYETFIFLRPRSPMADPVPPMTQAYLQGRANVDKFREFCAGLPTDRPMLTEVDAIRAFFFFAAHFVYDGKQPLEKTPGHVRKLPRIFEVFPNAKVIVCTRDPASIVSSYRKRLQKEQALGKGPDEWGWLDRTVEQLMGHFDGVSKMVVEARERWNEQIFIAPYDWLTDDPQQAFRQICEFAKLPFSEAVLKPKEVPGRKVDEMLSKPIAKLDPDVGKYLDEAEQAYIREHSASFLPLWTTPGVGAAP
jgi:Sulfotransferase family